MRKWEHKSVACRDLPDKLGQAEGNEGWELVTVLRYGYDTGARQGIEYRGFFRRPLPIELTLETTALSNTATVEATGSTRSNQ